MSGNQKTPQAQRRKGRGRTPDYHVSAMDTQTERRGRIGAAWTNEDGSISIVFNMCTVIDTRTQALNVRLFPNDNREEWES